MSASVGKVTKTGKVTVTFTVKKEAVKSVYILDTIPRRCGLTPRYL